MRKRRMLIGAAAWWLAAVPMLGMTQSWTVGDTRLHVGESYAAVRSALGSPASVEPTPAGGKVAIWVKRIERKQSQFWWVPVYSDVDTALRYHQHLSRQIIRCVFDKNGRLTAVSKRSKWVGDTFR